MSASSGIAAKAMRSELNKLAHAIQDLKARKVCIFLKVTFTNTCIHTLYLYVLLSFLAFPLSLFVLYLLKFIQ